MEDIEEVVVAKINGLNLEQLRLVAKCLELDSEIISTGMRSKLLKLILRTVCYEDSELPLIRELNEFIDTIYKQPDLPSWIEKPVQRKMSFTDMNVVKLRDFKIDGKIGTPGQKDKLTFSSLCFQIQNGVAKGYADSDICAAIVKSISPDLPIRAYLEGKTDLDLPSLSKILRSHFKEPNSTFLFNLLTNAKQSLSESAQEFAIRLMSIRQKILFVSREDSGLYSHELLQERFMHTILIGLRSDNVRNELRPILKNSIISDEDLLDNLSAAVSDQSEISEKFSRKSAVEINSVSTATNEAKPKPSKVNLLSEIEALKFAVNELTTSFKNSTASMENKIQNGDRSNFQTFRNKNFRSSNRPNNQQRRRCQYCVDNRSTAVFTVSLVVLPNI